MATRQFTVGSCVAGLLILATAACSQESIAPPLFHVAEELNIMVPMHDGVQLATDIYRPARDGRWPVVLWRNPYGEGGGSGDKTGHFFAKRGYVMVYQSPRGKGNSEGVFYPLLSAADDGFDTMQWIGAQAWCNGKIGTFGHSYDGMNQWLAASRQSRYLKSMFIVFATAGFYDFVFPGGALRLGDAAAASAVWTLPEGKPLPLPGQWGGLFEWLPLMSWDENLGWPMPCMRDFISHPSCDSYWSPLSLKDRFDQIGVPIFHVGGWYDIFGEGTVSSFSDMVRHGRTPAIRQGQRLLVGPWPHGTGMLSGRIGDMEFGDHSTLDLLPLALRWYDYTLKGQDNGLDQEPPIRLFVMGENTWHSEWEWPLQRTRFTSFFLHSDHGAGSLAGDGNLSTVKPVDDAPDRYAYDPASPVPTLGGEILFVWDAHGPRDQRSVEARADVLVYSTPVLEEAVEITGPVTLVLYASSSARDTDFAAKLVDVHPTGYAQNLTDGIIRARYRESRTHPTLIQPGAIYRYEIEVGVTSNLFHAGHRIRLEVSSSNFPRFDRNPNTGNPFGQDAKLEVAKQMVYHDAEHPSHLILPVIPR